MHMEDKRPNIARSALLIVDMQNDFLHPDGGFAHLARENPDAKIDMEFLRSTIPQVVRLADAFRNVGQASHLYRSCLKTGLLGRAISILAGHSWQPIS